jgi:hypothetical protein
MADVYVTLVAAEPFVANQTEVIAREPAATNLLAGNLYNTLRLRHEEEGKGVAVTTSPPPTPLKPPTGLRAAATGAFVQLTWDSLADANHYLVLWSRSPVITYDLWDRAETPGAADPGDPASFPPTTFTVGPLSPPGLFYFTILAYSDATHRGQIANPVQARVFAGVPSTAPDTVVVQGRAGAANIWWSSVPDATSYAVYWSALSAQGKSAARVAVVRPPLALLGQAAGVRYVTVAAVSAAGEGVLSKESFGSVT